MKKLYVLPIALTLLAALRPCRADDPQLTSWLKLHSEGFAGVYQNDRDRLNGTTVSTWSNGRLTQAQPARPGVQQILSSADWVYILSTGLGSHVMGPWYLDPQHRFPFPNLPTDQHFILRLPRHPAKQNTREFNPLGEIGMFVDGVRMFDANDSFSYSNEDGRDADPPSRIGHGDGIWNRDAYVNEGVTFDAALGHQQNWGRYHYHVQPIALRYLLGDHVDFDTRTKTYSESKSAPAKHSPILGWMHDGFPIYGPYGYSSPTNSASGARRMVSGFAARDGLNGTDNLARTGRHTLPAWAERERHSAVLLEPADFGPNVSPTYPLGHYLEDYAYLGDLGKIAGRDYDLDESNGRWCATPEFPQGTYAYFTTIDSTGKPVYPYNMGRRYYGIPNGKLLKGISEPVTTNFVARATSRDKAAPALGTISLQWERNSNDGYQATPK